jgi:hypothetical protein
LERVEKPNNSAKGRVIMKITEEMTHLAYNVSQDVFETKSQERTSSLP